MINPNRRSAEEAMSRAAEHAKKEEQFQQGNFEFTSHAGHILESSCRHASGSEDPSCLKCLYDRELKLDELPEMVFARNSLRLTFKNRTSFIDLNSLDALKLVCDNKLPDVQVGASTVWQKAREERLKQITAQNKPFDWTYTTFYKGTVENCTVEETTDKIDMERLKRRDHIMFHSHVTLFEDELADHGIAQLSARVRVMETGYFFVLLRFYMRVDNVLIRCCDTRIVGDATDNFVLREWQRREAKYEDLKHIDEDKLFNIDMAWTLLPIVESTNEKITAN